MNKEIKEKKVPFLRRPFTKLVFGKVREFANRKEYKEFYYANRNKNLNSTK